MQWIARLWHRVRTQRAKDGGFHCWGCMQDPTFHTWDPLYNTWRRQ